jgi:hypothetical protein
MEKIKEFIRKPAALAIGAFIVGIVIGLVVLGWGIWPLEWVDTAPADLRVDFQRDYLCMAVDSYAKNQDLGLAQSRWNNLGENASAVLDSLTPAACGQADSTEIDAFKGIVSYKPQALANEAGNPVVQESPIAATTEPKPESTFSLAPLLILVALTLIVGGLFVYLMKRRAGKPIFASRPAKPNKAAPAANKNQVHSTAQNAPKKEPALAQFMTTYRQGDDLYDDSFSIDSVNGEFLGECGVGIAETIGVGDPKKVTALEVWLFDKNDIQTVTKILMSEHASNDSAIRQRMVSKGEPIKVEPGMTFVMETATLQMEAKVIDMVYARGPLPENSYFSRLTMEISVWAK